MPLRLLVEMPVLNRFAVEAQWIWLVGVRLRLLEEDLGFGVGWLHSVATVWGEMLLPIMCRALMISCCCIGVGWSEQKSKL